MKVVPFHHFLNEDDTQTFLDRGIKLSMLKIDVGHDVLVLEAHGYPEALVSQIVGPMGSVTVLCTNQQRMETIEAKMIEADKEKAKRMEYILVDDFIEGANEKLPKDKRFDAILTPCALILRCVVK